MWPFDIPWLVVESGPSNEPGMVSQVERVVLDGMAATGCFPGVDFLLREALCSILSTDLAVA